MNAMLRNPTVLFTSLATKSACLIASRKRTVLTSKLEVPVYCNAVIYCQRRFKETDYSKFGNEPDKPTKYGIFYRLFLAAAPWIIFFSPIGDWLLGTKNQVDADTKKDVKSIKPEEQAEHDENKDVAKKKSGRVGFRNRKIIEYENRIREYSTPDKIFRYFATLKAVHDNGEWEVFMTPEDFVRSITPSMKQPEGLGLDQFKKFNAKLDGIKSSLPSDSIFYELAEHGLISFSDYIFLLVVLSTPSRLFEIGLKMFDINSDGSVEFSEFDKMQSIAMKQCSVGIKHRDHSTTGSMLESTHSAIATYFFGKSLNQSMTVDKFCAFQDQLNREILFLEFSRYDPENGKISGKDFARSLLAFVGFKDTRGKKMMKRVKKAFSDKESCGITFQEYMDFYHAMLFVNNIDTALNFYNISGASIDKATLKHVAKTVADTKLSDQVVDVVFALFDENGDGQLSNKEFVAIMKRRMTRGLERPKDTGFMRLVSSAWRCTSEAFLV